MGGGAAILLRAGSQGVSSNWVQMAPHRPFFFLLIPPPFLTLFVREIKREIVKVSNVSMQLAGEDKFSRFMERRAPRI